MAFDVSGAATRLATTWRDEIVPTLVEYVAVPNVSPAFDADWESAGHMDHAVDLLTNWAQARPVEGLEVHRHDLVGRTPLVELTIPAHGAAADAPVTLIYGHLDKQPPMTGWRDGLGPWSPVVEDGRLYGRGGADDGYALFAALAAIEAVQHCGGGHGPIRILIEASEESGSPDLPHHLAALGDRLEPPDLVVCLDSGALDYERLWVTTSLRGVAIVDLEVGVLTEGVHSGSAGAVVPSSFAVARSLLDRIEDATSGRIVLDALHGEVPAERRTQAEATAALLVARGEQDLSFPYLDGTRPLVEGLTEQMLARTWSPSLEVTGAAGIPALADAGNVLRPATTLRLSLRLPPAIEVGPAIEALEATLSAQPPFGASVRIDVRGAEAGWDAPATAPWLDAALGRAARAGFGHPPAATGEGGTIPFMGMLGRQFPDAQFVVTGVLGPGSNAHGPNEFLHLDYAEHLTVAVTALLAGARLDHR